MELSGPSVSALAAIPGEVVNICRTQFTIPCRFPCNGTLSPVMVCPVAVVAVTRYTAPAGGLLNAVGSGLVNGVSKLCVRVTTALTISSTFAAVSVSDIAFSF